MFEHRALQAAQSRNKLQLQSDSLEAVAEAEEVAVVGAEDTAW
jgi:hypothetical protein